MVSVQAVLVFLNCQLMLDLENKLQFAKVINFKENVFEFIFKKFVINEKCF